MNRFSITGLLVLSYVFSSALQAFAQEEFVSFKQYIIVSVDSMTNRLTFGQLSDATDGFDLGVDLPAPPSPPDVKLRAVLHNSLEDFVNGYSTDLRAEARRDTFLILFEPLTSPLKVQLSWPKIDNFDGDLFLKINGMTKNLKAADSVMIELATLSADSAIIVAFHEPVSVPTNTGTTTSERAFELHQNYPNPFNPETTIRYRISNSLNTPVDVKLRIFNLKGQLVSVLVDEKKSAGVYNVTWDGTDNQGLRVSTGIFFYTLSAGDFQSSKKLILIK